MKPATSHGTSQCSIDHWTIVLQRQHVLILAELVALAKWGDAWEIDSMWGYGGLTSSSGTCASCVGPMVNTLTWLVYTYLQAMWGYRCISENIFGIRETSETDLLALEYDQRIKEAGWASWLLLKWCWTDTKRQAQHGRMFYVLHKPNMPKHTNASKTN